TLCRLCKLRHFDMWRIDMEWFERFAAIRIQSSDEGIHIVERRLLQDGHGWRYTDIKTYCGIILPEYFDELKEDDVNCMNCTMAVEKQQSFWKAFWSSSDGRRIYRILSGSERREREMRESTRQTEEFLRKAEAFNKLLEDCLKHHQPVFTLELPDEILLKLMDYGSVGEVLLAFKMSDETRKLIQTTLGKEGFALLGSRLISKGLLKANDPIFDHRW